MAFDIQRLGRTVKQVQVRQHRNLEKRLATVGTTLAQWDALRAIDRTPGASAHDLCQATFQTDQAFGTLANRLADQGLIERTPGQGRRIEHHLTPAGRKILAAGNRIATEMLTEMYAVFSETERRTLLDLLSRLTGETRDRG